MTLQIRGMLLTALFLVAAGCTAQKQEEIASAPKVAEMRAEQVEAEQMLAQILAMQQGYFATHREYSSTLDELGIGIPSNARYRYALTASASHFTCEATANLDADATTDRWQATEEGGITCVSNDATS